MKQQWLQQSDNDKLIIIFGGWALGSTPFKHLTAQSDILLLSDYRDLSFSLELIRQYRHCNLIAYSFGIAAAGHALGAMPIEFTRKIAVCGSLFPCDDKRGISSATVRKMADDLTEQSLSRFAARAGGALPENMDLKVLQDELYVTIARGAAPYLQFDKVWLGRKDRIFSKENLQQAWIDQTEKTQWLEAGHNPFPLFETWEELLT